MNYLVLGLGFVATHVAEFLSNYGNVTVTYRNLNPVKEEYVKILKEKKVEVVKLDPLTDDIKKYISQSDVVINLIGEISGSEETLRRANVEVPERLAKVVSETNRNVILIHLSGLPGVTGNNVKPEVPHCEGIKPTTPFEKTKCEGEKILRDNANFLAILRPSLIYGKYGAHIQFVTMFRFAKMGFVPSLGFRFSVISAKALSEIIKNISEAKPKFTYFYVTECEPVRIDIFFEIMAKTLGKGYIKVPIPKFLAKAYLPSDIRNLLKYDGTTFDCTKAKEFSSDLKFEEKEVEDNAKFLEYLDKRKILIST
jgi:nucleoside-diphosphate-sugar epimerase